MSWLYPVLALVALQRLAELAWARRNERRLRAEGAVEHGRRHYPLFVLLHGSWLAALALTVSADRPVVWPWLALFALLQAARIWVIVSLGRYWTTRILSLPEVPLVRRGPYRLLHHPNYLIVALEIVVLPLAFSAPLLALGFGAANGLLLMHRIRVEERSLAPRRGLAG
ncbi:MAG TPA: isoprenylcysteine carboxylmethyltransferase family protein [Alphaproteobacteria bacterium]|nr:isoprenylcysteine carboxylmethyltransferase family protein [Alphaproteobacteria bacterium]